MRHLIKLVIKAAGYANDMLHFNVTDNECIGDEASVAPPRQDFSTHQRKAVFPCKRDDFQQVIGELLGLHKIGVASETHVFPCKVDAVAFGMA